MLSTLFGNGNKSPIGEFVNPEPKVIVYDEENEFNASGSVNLIEAVRYNTKNIVDRIDKQLENLELQRKRLLLLKKQHNAMLDALLAIETETD